MLKFIRFGAGKSSRKTLGPLKGIGLLHLAQRSPSCKAEGATRYPPRGSGRKRPPLALAPTKSPSIDRCKIKGSAPRRWLETVLRATPRDKKSSSVELGLLVSHRFETRIPDGSPHWTRFELSRPKTRTARTNSIALRPMTSAQNRRTHPDWAPSRDYSRTTREPATSNRQSTNRDRDDKRCGVREDLSKSNQPPRTSQNRTWEVVLCEKYF
jgi:hypothetical protein